MASTASQHLKILREAGLINDQLGGLPILLLYNAQLNSAVAYSRDFESGPMTFALNENGQLIDLESNSSWDIESGVALAGPMQGMRLSRLTAPLVFWFAWSDIYPDTEIYTFDE